ncbi:MAG: diguanylate cyclase [Kineosporiaceae bacterium]
MSLRARLALVLAGGMFGPLFAAWLVIGVLAPRQVSASTDQAAGQAADAVKQELTQACLGVGDTLTAVSNRLLAGAVVSQTITQRAAREAVEAAAARREGFQVVVLGPDGQALASAGPVAPEAAGRAARVQLGASCSQGRGVSSDPALSQSVPVELTGAAGDASTVLARVVVWYPVDDGSLDRVVAALGLPAADDVLVTAPHASTASAPEAGGGGVLATTMSEELTIAVRAAMPHGSLSGEIDGRHYQVRPAYNGVPFDVVGLSRARDLARLQLTLLAVVTVTAVGAVVLVSLLAGRLTAPLEHVAAVADRLRRGDLSARTGLRGRDEVGRLATSFDAMADELERTVGALRDRSRAVAEMFDNVGEALGRSHDLDGLVATVLDSAMLGADASVGLVLLGDVGGLQVQACHSAAGRPDQAPAVAEALGVLAGRSVERRELVRGRREGGPEGAAEADAVPEGLQAALALPLMKGDRVFGALAIAREDGAQDFDAETVSAIRVLSSQAGTAVANVRQHEETRRQSVTDPLTGAGNFRHLSATLAREVERASRFGHPLAVLMLDLDKFKDVNDTMGHAFGDGVLREFARRLQECLREVDTVARYGGEEFCVIAPETDLAGARRVADRIVQVVRAEPFTVGRRSRPVTVSVGVAVFPDHGTGAAELMGAADVALYAAKRTGRDRWVVAGASGGARVEQA